MLLKTRVRVSKSSAWARKMCVCCGFPCKFSCFDERPCQQGIRCTNQFTKRTTPLSHGDQGARVSKTILQQCGYFILEPPAIDPGALFHASRSLCEKNTEGGGEGACVMCACNR